MPCDGNPLDQDASAAQRLALERARLECFTKLYHTLRKDITTTIPDDELDVLGIYRGSLLDLDDLNTPSQSDVSSRFFSPCTWTQTSLDWESHSGYTDSKWKNLTSRNPAHFEALDFGRFRASWFHVRLLSLESIEENVWEPVIRHSDSSRWDRTREEIEESIGLELPRYEYAYDTWDLSEHQFKGTWAYFAAAAADRPHAVCTMIDSASPTDQGFIRSEVQAAVRMTEFQHQRACFTHHHTKPILVCTYFRNETARITQAHLDTIRGKLALRQSRLLDLSGPDTPPDAWLMLRWMASGPVGLTQYQSSAILPRISSEDRASRPPQISLAS